MKNENGDYRVKIVKDRNMKNMQKAVNFSV